MRFRLISLCLLVVALASGAVTPPPVKRALPLNHFPASRAIGTDRDGFYFMPTAVGDDYFDGTDSPARIQRHLTIAMQLGVRYLRCAFSWNGIERAPGVYDWRFWDQLVSLAQQSGIELIPYVAYTPRWAARDAHEFWKQPPRDPQLLASFMAVLAARYRGRIHSWEIWNEPDLSEYWQGSVGEFARLVEVTAPAIRRADPAAVLVLGGMSLGPSPFFQALVRDYHIDRYVDVIAMHGYPETWLEDRTETVYGQKLAAMTDLVAADRSGDDFWANELGYSDYRFAPDKASMYGITVQYAYEHTPQYAAVSLFKAEVMALASGRASLTMWYRIDDLPTGESRQPAGEPVNFHLGLMDTRGRPKPAFYALKFFNVLFDRPTRLMARRGGGAEQQVIDTFEKRDGKVVVVGWLRSSTHAEVADKSGLATDRRWARASIELPCSEVHGFHSFDAEGRATPSSAQFAHHRLENIPLRGDSLFIAEFACDR